MARTREQRKAYARAYYLGHKQEFRAYQKEWRKKNPEKLTEQTRRKSARMADEARTVLRELKESSGCVRCGLKDARCLDLHHRNPHDKSFNVGVASCRRGIKALLTEAAKCEVLCSNCHRIIHAEMRCGCVVPDVEQCFLPFAP